jgi:hypothetical protein
LQWARQHAHAPFAHVNQLFAALSDSLAAALPAIHRHLKRTLLLSLTLSAALPADLPSAQQDSGADGAGYETALKGGAIAVGKAGTKKVKAASKSGSKAGTAKSSPLASFFDK